MNSFKKQNSSNGFTLIEIVIVIGIMALFSAVIYSSFDTSRAKSRDQKRISDISTIQIALEQFFQKYGVYPITLTDPRLTPFLGSIPTDPTNNYINNYFPITRTSLSNDCISYQLWTKFEKINTYLDSKRGFNSTASFTNMFECGGSGHKRIDASADALVYDVMP